jgi:hypothetical protein
MDVVINDLDGSPMILRNKGIPGRHWVSFELAGTKSNRLALNARIKIVAGGLTQTDEIHSGGSYLSQNDLRVHFGLASAEKIDRRWIISAALQPIGSIQSWKVKELFRQNAFGRRFGHTRVQARIRTPSFSAGSQLTRLTCLLTGQERLA